MGPRWKGKGTEAKALTDPMSKIVSEHRLSLTESNSEGLLPDCSPIHKDKQWAQLSTEEAFYLCYALKCIKIACDKCLKTDEEFWSYATSKRADFPNLYKAYSRLRMKNWVVRAGSQYGVDFVAYRHHPSLVHSEYAVLVLSEEDGNSNGRLRVWSDVQCMLRLCGSVAKTLLVLNINKNGNGATSPSCLENCNVEERMIASWKPEQCRENQTGVSIQPGLV